MLRTLCQDYAEDKGKIDFMRPLATAPILRTPQGKPFFSGLPQIHFSVSHSGAVWGCAVDSHAVGFDLEDMARSRVATGHKEIWEDTQEKRDSQRWRNIAERFFTPEEYQFVLKGGKHAFFQLWVRKEAYFKYRGTGISGGLAGIDLISCGECITQLSDVWIEELCLDAGLIAAYCAAGKRTIEKIFDCHTNHTWKPGGSYDKSER